MTQRITILVFLAFIFSFTSADAQNRFYHVYVDSDNDSASGCNTNLPDFATSIDGAESRLTITTNNNLPPAITATRLHQCNGGTFDAGTAISPAALGLNTGDGGADVFEAAINQSDLSINTSGPVIFYYASQSDSASDIVLTSSSGGSIFLGFTFPVPALGLLALAMLLVFLLFTAKKSLSRNLTVSILLVGVVTVVYAMNIIIDGQTNDWANINPANTDPIGDTSVDGSFADFSAVYLTRSDSEIFVRMDLVDLENQAPVAVSTSDSTLEENAVTITLTGSDAEGSAITFATATTPANGSLSAYTVVNNTTSTVQYTPNTDFNGTDSFTVVANDGQVNSAPATVDVNVGAINDEPTFNSGGNINQLKTAGPYSEIWATNISAGAVNENTQNLTFNILANDNAAIFTVQPSIDSNGNLSFTGVPDATGIANMTVNLTDDGGTANGGDDTSTSVNFTITLQGVNDEPSFTAGGDQVVLEDAGAQTVAAWATNILAGPPDEITQTLTFIVTNNGDPSLFSAAPQVNPITGDLTFTTAADANGIANLSVVLMDDGGTANGGDDTSPAASVNITVTGVNDVPSFTPGGDVAVNENNGAYDSLWATAISAGPIDENGQTLNFNVINVTNNALFSVEPTVNASTGNLSFTPAIDTFGVSTVTINLMDDGLTANGGVDTSANITFDIRVDEVNEAPVLANIPNPTVDELTLLSFTATATDPNVPAQNLTFSLGGAVPAGANITPAGDFTWTPTEAQGTTGTFTFDVIVTDDGTNPDNLTDSQSITVTVNKANTAPVLTAIGAQSVDELVALNFTATATDADDPAQNLTYSLGGTVPAGATISAAGAFSWTPTEAQGPGVYTFDVIVTDDGSNPANLSDTETISVTVNDVNSAPVLAAIGNQSVDEETLLSFNAAATDSDLPAQSLSFSLAGTVPAGASITPAGVFSWTPTEAQGFGVYSFDVVVTDDGSNPATLSDSETISVTVNEVNAPPVANAQSTTTDDATPLLITLTGSDSEGSTLTFSIVTPPATGSLGAITQIPPSSASVTYTPGSVGDNSFTFLVNDGALNSTPATVTLDVTSSNTAPTGVNDAYSVTGNVGINVPVGNGVTSNDTDPEFDTLTVSAFDAVSVQGGTVSVNANGSFTYDPAAGYTGADSFNYTVSDGALTDTATVNLTVANKVWFIDNSAAAGGDGRLISPFNSISSFNSTATDAIGDVIYIDAGTGTTTGYDTGITLLNNQRLLGQGVALNTANTGITFPAHTRTLPATAASNPTIVTINANSIVLGNSNTIRGLTVGNTGTGTAITGNTFGTLTVSDVSISGTGKALDLINGTMTATFDSLGSTSSASEALDLNNVAGSLTVNGGTMSGAGANANTVLINNASGTLTASFDGITIGSNDAATGLNGIAFITTATATANLNINGSVFTGSRRGMILADVGGTGGGTINIGSSLPNLFVQDQSPDPLGGDDVIHINAVGSAGTVTSNIIGNSIQSGFFTFEGDGIAIQNINTFTGTHRATVSGNTIGVANSNGSAFDPLDNQGDAGIEIIGSGTNSMIALVSNNSVFDYNASGIEANFNDNGNYDVTIINNTVSDGLGSSGFDAAIAVFGGGSVTACVQVDSNALNDPTNEEADVDILGTGTYRDPGLAVFTDPGLETHILNTNSGTPPYTAVAFTVGVSGGAGCAQP